MSEKLSRYPIVRRPSGEFAIRTPHMDGTTGYKDMGAFASAADAERYRASKQFADRMSGREKMEVEGEPAPQRADRPPRQRGMPVRRVPKPGPVALWDGVPKRSSIEHDESDDAVAPPQKTDTR